MARKEKLDNVPSPSTKTKTRTQVKNKAKKNKAKKGTAKVSVSTGSPSSMLSPLSKAAKKREKEKLKKQKWIEKRQEKYPHKTKKELLAAYKKHQAVLRSPEHRAKIEAAKARRLQKQLESATDEKENLLQRFKDSQSFSHEEIPSLSAIEWENFNETLDSLPDEIRISLTEAIQALSEKYGEPAVSEYLRNEDLLSTSAKFTSYDYKVLFSRIFLYRLALALEYALEGEIGDIAEEQANDSYEIDSTFNSIVKSKNTYKYEGLLQVSDIISESEAMGLPEKVMAYFDSIEAERNE